MTRSEQILTHDAVVEELSQQFRDATKDPFPPSGERLGVSSGEYQRDDDLAEELSEQLEDTDHEAFPPSTEAHGAGGE